MGAKIKFFAVAVGIVISFLTVSPFVLGANSGWKVKYGSKGGVIINIGKKEIFNDSDGLALLSTKPSWHAIYAWSQVNWATNMAHPTKEEMTTKGGKKVIIFSDKKEGVISLTKQIIEISPRELQIVIKAVTPANGPGNVLSYSGTLSEETYTGASLSTDGRGFPLNKINPLQTDWIKRRDETEKHKRIRPGDDLRYNISTASLEVKGIGTIIFTLSEDPASPKDARGWRFWGGVAGNLRSPDYAFNNIYYFDPAVEFERTLEINITWEKE